MAYSDRSRTTKEFLSVNLDGFFLFFGGVDDAQEPDDISIGGVLLLMKSFASGSAPRTTRVDGKLGDSFLTTDRRNR
jgi:hypothetical protein